MTIDLSCRACMLAANVGSLLTATSHSVSVRYIAIYLLSHTQRTRTPYIQEFVSLRSAARSSMQWDWEERKSIPHRQCDA